jgi:hypothetical protein
MSDVSRSSTHPVSGDVVLYNSTIGSAAWGRQLPIVVAQTLQKPETTAADAALLTFTPPAGTGTYRMTYIATLTSATSGVVSFTMTWTDASGTVHTDVALILSHAQVATTATTFTVSAADYFRGQQQFDIDNSGTAITIKWVGGGTSAGFATAILEQLA